VSSEVSDIASQLKRELEYEQEIGVPDLPMPKKTNQPATSSPVHQTTSTPKGESLDDIRADIGDCTRCKLCEGRTNIVFGVGNPNADIMFIGEGPGRDEDLQGEPFVGRAGQLLTRIIQAMGLERKDVYIANIVKCRPPNNRNPEADEMATCSPFLYRQIAAIKPKVLIGLGNIAIQTLLQTKTGITRLRGQFHEVAGIPLMPTFHPAFLLRNANKKKEVWEDVQKVMEKLGMNVPKSK
jgi:DNA polymerase